MARPYGKTGPLKVAHPLREVHHPYKRVDGTARRARSARELMETYDRKMMTVGLDLSGVTHGFVTSKVAQSYRSRRIGGRHNVLRQVSARSHVQTVPVGELRQHLVAATPMPRSRA